MFNADDNMQHGNVLVFSVALNGYQFLYKKNFASHKRYCDKHGYHYRLFDKPYFSRAGIECAWLKIYLMISMLDRHYDWIVFLDADTEVKEHAPAISTLETEGKSIYAAKGYSGRINSGVLIIKNDPGVRYLLGRCLNSMNKDVPAADDVGWGENGHIIHLFKSQEMLQYIGPQWNNNHSKELDDYIRHYSAGPLREEYKAPVLDRLMFRVTNFISRVIAKYQRVFHAGSHDKKRLLDSEYRKCLRYL